MTQTFTPTTQGLSAQTIDFLRQFARNYKSQRRIGRYIILRDDESKVLGES